MLLFPSNGKMKNNNLQARNPVKLIVERHKFSCKMLGKAQSRMHFGALDKNEPCVEIISIDKSWAQISINCF